MTQHYRTARAAQSALRPPPAHGFSQGDLARARAEGVEQGIQAERARVVGLLGHATASCPPLAFQCIATGLSAEQATAILGAAGADAEAAVAARIVALIKNPVGN